MGAVLNFDGGEIDGRKFESPPPTEETTYLRNWVEFRHDGTVVGTYGCTPFRMTADVRATDLTLEEDTVTAAVEGCPQSLMSFERQLGEIFTGHLAISARKAERAGEDSTVDLKNDRGDHIALSVTRPAQGFFGTRQSRDIVQTRRKPLTRLSSVTTCTFAEKRWVGEEALAARS
ncbi:META domain-containing protein [Streptomyces sp. NPDC059122]|uniref:META domain-containing protein n=1 Tax=Streptomyces sp. NPDC059122 TaxID=3346732 RepID=UPI00368A7771